MLPRQTISTVSIQCHFVSVDSALQCAHLAVMLACGHFSVAWYHQSLHEHKTNKKTLAMSFLKILNATVR